MMIEKDSSRTVWLALPGRRIEMTAPAAFDVPRIIEKGGVKGHEPHAIACALALTEMTGGAFFDVGANVGVFAITVAAVLGQRCHAFEPTPELADVLEVTASRADLPIVTHRYALADTSGEATLYLSAKSDSSNSLNRKFRRHVGEIKVRVAALDELGLEAPAVMKIDTETSEPAVLKGAQRTIAEARPFLICEALPGRTEEKLNAFLHDFSYTSYQITEAPRWRSQSNVATKDTVNHNWLFAPDPVAEDFWSRLDVWRNKILEEV